MSHAILVEVARKWLKGYCRCPIVITEMVTGAMETPDAIGWWRSGATTVIECKASRSDFLADRKKFFRREPRQGMGAYRYFLAPAGMLRPEEMPAGWGLLEVTAKRVSITRKSHGDACDCKWGICITAFPERRVAGEFQMLVSLIRRLAGPGVRGKATVDIDPYRNDEHGNVVTAELTVEQSELPRIGQDDYADDDTYDPDWNDFADEGTEE